MKCSLPKLLSFLSAIVYAVVPIGPSYNAHAESISSSSSQEFSEIAKQISRKSRAYFDQFYTYRYDFEIYSEHKMETPSAFTRTITGRFAKEGALIYAEGLKERPHSDNREYSEIFQIGSNGDTMYLCRSIGDTNRLEKYVLQEGASAKGRSMLRTYAWDFVPLIKHKARDGRRSTVAEQFEHLRKIASRLDIEWTNSGSILEINIKSEKGTLRSYWKFNMDEGVLLELKKEILHREEYMVHHSLKINYSEFQDTLIPSNITYHSVSPTDPPQVQDRVRATISNFSMDPKVKPLAKIKEDCAPSMPALVHDQEGEVIEERSRPPETVSDSTTPSETHHSSGSQHRLVAWLLKYSGIGILAIGAIAIILKLRRREY